jgi:imidazolonepropionase-like amidohydrolase
MRIAALAVLSLFIAAPAPAAETVRYTAFAGDGARAGHQIVEHGDDGVTRVDFIFKDNGRGPELKEEYTLAPDGTFARYRVQGASTFGAPVDESFARDGARVTWKSTSDEGAREVAAGAQYSPLGGTPQASSVAITALLSRPDGRLPLIPSGTLSARQVVELEVAADDGRRQRVQLLAITGIGFTPSFAWATTGDAPRLFAFIYPGWVRLIEDGWHGNGDALEARQKQAEGEVLADLQRRLAHPLRGSTLVRNARVFDSERAQLGPPSDVLVRDGRIAAVSPAGRGPARADQVVDAAGRVLLPGLFDMHVHAGRWDGALHLAAGVTTVRDMGNDNTLMGQLVAEERAGTLLSPRIVASGFIEGESPMASRGGFVIDSLEEARAAVDWYAAHDYLGVKIYNSFPRELLADTVAYAHAKGLRVSGHVPVHMLAHEVVEQGYDEVQHINQLALNFLATRETDTRTLERFYLVAKGAGDLDLDSSEVQDFIALLRARGTVVDPTLATFEFLHQRNGQPSPIFAAIEAHVPPDVQRSRRAAEMDIPDDATGARYKRSFDNLVALLGRMYRAGVPVVAGTDEVPGFTLQRELELYVQAGLTPAQALQVATWNGAKYTRTLDDRGSIAPGKRADLVLVDGDPTTDVSDLRRTVLVIKGDTAYYPAELHDALGIRPFAEPLRLAAGGAAP